MHIGRSHPVLLLLGALLLAALWLFRGYLTPVLPDLATPASSLDTLELPPGFTIQLYATDVPCARSMTIDPFGSALRFSLLALLV